MHESKNRELPSTLGQALGMVAAGGVCIAFAVGLNTWAGWRSWVGVMSMFIFGMNGLGLLAIGAYSSVVFGQDSVPDRWRNLYTVAVTVGTWLACLALFTEGASLGRMTLSGWSAVWRGLKCIAVFALARHLAAESTSQTKLKAYLWSIATVAAVMWLAEQGVFSGPPEDDPFDVPEPLPPDVAADLALFNYVTYSLSALLGVARAPRKSTV
jgi:hypothetical protein